MSEIWTLKETWATDMSPTALFSSGTLQYRPEQRRQRAGDGVPGVWDDGWAGRGAYRYPTRPVPGPTFSHI